MEEEQLKLIYSNMIAGRLPCGSASALRVVTNQAQAILGTDRLHIYIHERNGFLYYFAVESRYLTSASDFLLPFAQVLPESPEYKGDGIYLLQFKTFAVALLLEGGSAHLYCNDPDVLNDYLLEFELQTFRLNPQGGASMRSVPQRLLGVAEKVSRYLFGTSAAILCGSLLLFVGIESLQAYKSARDQSQTNARMIENDLNKTLSKLNVQQPLARQIFRVEKVSATVVRAGGWIERYTLKGEKNENFELVLPSWVSQDYLDSLGRDVVTDLRDTEGLLTVRKISKGKKP